MVEDAEKKTAGFTTRISMAGHDEQITTTRRRCNTTVQLQSLGSVTKLLPMATAMSNHYYFHVVFLYVSHIRKFLGILGTSFLGLILFQNSTISSDRLLVVFVNIWKDKK